jgi:hypothetical protein
VLLALVVCVFVADFAGAVEVAGVDVVADGESSAKTIAAPTRSATAVIALTSFMRNMENLRSRA